MLAQILVVILSVTVAAVVVVDFARTDSEDLLGHPDGSGYEIRPMVIGGTRGDHTGALFGEPFGADTPAAEHDVGLGQRPGRMDPSTADFQPSHAGSPMGQGPSATPDRVSRERSKRHVRSRLQLLVIIPAVAVAVVAACVVGLVGALSSTRTNSPSNQAVAWAVVLGVVTIVVLVLAARATIGTARSVLQPLYRLRGRALGLADGGASDEVPADLASPDEIGDIARAFEQMRTRVSRLGSNEAGLRNKLDPMFVNLSHRSQSLVERQMRLIENLVQWEQDRERRAVLFRMNRIAARMHRDSQNLLVLAGHELPSNWNQPMALMNIIRAAVSEIEEYERVSVYAQPDIALSGPAVNDMVHLLAELIQNATSFSAVDMPVEVTGQLLNTGGVLISITDRGVGMSTQEIAHANWRLENPPPPDVEVPKWIGLLVVARLAVRRGVRVRLQEAEFGGLTAHVWIPDELTTRETAVVPRDFSHRGLGGPRRAAHGITVDARGAAPQQHIAATQAAGIRQGWQQGPDASAQLASAPSAQLASAPSAIGVPPQKETDSGDSIVIVPSTGNPAEERRLPIFEAVESNWFRGGRQVPGSADTAVRTGSQWSSPADVGWRAAETVESPTVGSSTEAGLPRRQPNANLVPGAVPSTQPAAVPSRSPAEVRERLARFQRGATEGRATASEAAGTTGDNES